MGFFVAFGFAFCEVDVDFCVSFLPDADFRDLLDEFRDKEGFGCLGAFAADGWADGGGGGGLAKVVEELLDVDEAREGREAKDVEEAMEEKDVDEAMERIEEAIVWS